MNPILYDNLINIGIFVFIAIVIWIKINEILSENKKNKIERGTKNGNINN